MTYETTIDAGLFGEIDVRVEYDYHPGEKTVLYPAELAYEGCPEHVEITKLELRINDAWVDAGGSLPDELAEEIEAEIMENSDDY